MKLQKLRLLIGILSLVICLISWALDLTHLVIDCIYCQTERTIVGFLGILILLPIYPYITRYLAFVSGFLGASVASQQILLILKSGNLYPRESELSVVALFIIIGQVFFSCYLDQQKYDIHSKK